MLTSLQILNQAEPMVEASVEPVKRAINQPVAENQTNLGL
jgi:hypothetical protein